METFLPGSQIDVKPVTDYDQFVGKTMEFKVVKINEAIKNAVVSHKALIESDIEAQRAKSLASWKKARCWKELSRTSLTLAPLLTLAAWMVCYISLIFHGDVSTIQAKY